MANGSNAAATGAQCGSNKWHSAALASRLRASLANCGFRGVIAADQVDVDGLTIAYRRMGQGPPLVLLHGFFGDSRVWRPQFELADEYAVVAWDCPGCGGSTTPPPAFRMRDFARLLGSFIRALELDRPHVLGLSFGGTLALELYRQRPELPRTLVLADTYAGWSGSFPPEVVEKRLQGSLPDLLLSPEEVVEKWMPGFVTAGAPSRVVEELETIIRDFDPAGMEVMIRSLAEADLRAVLPEVRIPTLLIWGAEDVRSPLAVTEAMRAGIDGAELSILAAAGHLSNQEAAEAFTGEVRAFLRRQDHG